MKVEPFDLPLSRDQFKAALERGQGRALLHVIQYGAAGVEDLILDACLHDQTYDTQCEEERAPWMMEMIDAAELPVARVLPRITEKLPRAASEARRDAEHLCRLAGFYARRGHQDARNALYAVFESSFGQAEGSLGLEQIVQVDGEKGLLHIAEIVARSPEGALKDLEMAAWFFEEHGKGNAVQALRRAAARDERMAKIVASVGSSSKTEEKDFWVESACRAAADERRRRKREEELRGVAREEILSDIGAPKPVRGRCFWSMWAKHASEADLRDVAARLFEESRPEPLTRLLWVFTRRPLPEFDPRLLAFANHPDDKVRWAAHKVLANHRHESVRALALDCARMGHSSEGELLLFRENYHAGDWDAIDAGLNLPEDRVELHSIGHDLLDVFENNLTREAHVPLLIVYEYTPCLTCRRLALELLMKAAVAPEWVLRESHFDANSSARELVGTPSC